MGKEHYLLTQSVVCYLLSLKGATTTLTNSRQPLNVSLTKEPSVETNNGGFVSSTRKMWTLTVFFGFLLVPAGVLGKQGTYLRLFPFRRTRGTGKNITFSAARPAVHQTEHSKAVKVEVKHSSFKEQSTTLLAD